MHVMCMICMTQSYTRSLIEQHPPGDLNLLTQAAAVGKATTTSSPLLAAIE